MVFGSFAHDIENGLRISLGPNIHGTKEKSRGNREEEATEDVCRQLTARLLPIHALAQRVKAPIRTTGMCSCVCVCSSTQKQQVHPCERHILSKVSVCVFVFLFGVLVNVEERSSAAASSSFVRHHHQSSDLFVFVRVV